MTKKKIKKSEREEILERLLELKGISSGLNVDLELDRESKARASRRGRGDP